jgi:hypothetical protein
MANYYYLNSTSSTNDGLYTSLQTGAWPSNNFDTLNALITYATFATGDFIIVSVDHEETVSQTGDITGVTTGGGATYMTMVSTANAECETYTPATAYQFSVTGVHKPTQLHVFGIYYKSARNNPIQCNQALNSMVAFNDCIFQETSGADDSIFAPGVAYSDIIWRNCEFKADSGVTTASICTCDAVSLSLQFENCTLTGLGDWDSVVKSATAQSKTTAKGCDFSQSTQLLALAGGSVSDDEIIMRLDNCEVDPNVVWVEETPANANFSFEAYNCTNSDDENPNEFYIQQYTGTAESEIGAAGAAVVRTDDDVMEMEAANEYMSVKVTPNSFCSPHYPLSFEMPATWSAFTAGATDTIRVYLTCAETLYDEDIIISVSYRDATNVEQINTNQVGADWNPLTPASSELTTDSGSTWNTGLTNEYYIDVECADGLDQVPILTIHVRKAVAAPFYFDTGYDLV